jgi:pimeloyl-ACP methyl ester carboxylesterase
MSPSGRRFSAGGPPPAGLGAWREGGRPFDFVGTSVFCRAQGSSSGGAAAALFLHGVPGSSLDFAGLGQRLGRGRTVGAFDFVGFGLSGDAGGFGYSIADQADVALAAAAALGLKRVHLVAHDVGGAVAAELLARRERGLLRLSIDSLTLLGGGPLSGLRTPARLLRWVRRLAAGGVSSRALSFALFRWAFLRHFGDAGVPRWGEVWQNWGFFVEGEGGRRPELALGYVDELRHPPARWWSALARLELPTLVLAGAHDRVLGDEYARQLARHMPRARLRRLAGLGHSPHLEAPHVVAAELEAFWGDLEGPLLTRAAATIGPRR